jgi:hypothetical protein
MLKTTITAIILFLFGVTYLQAQDSSKIYLTTSIGLLVPAKKFANAYSTSLALNSGIEYKIGSLLFAQFEIDFNAVKYNQQYKDNGSGYLFQKTNSSFFLAGFNFGKNILFGKTGKLFSSVYIGTGYINIGEPRLTVNLTTNVIEQQVNRTKGVFGKTGIRLGYKTASKFLQTIYADGSYWFTNLTVQQSKAQAFSVYIGTRIGF